MMGHTDYVSTSDSLTKSQNQMHITSDTWDEIMQSLQGATIFLTQDMRSAYWPMPLHLN